ncbi:CD209 antigen-like [Takifugu rubripes]|uniref:CD209 antigen-like n=1 Tax=Takifugu rubripes TaxID=31033 RepID=UPI0011456F47|nr:CD209 antigen-like [Takifugu rubripes]
MGDSSMIEELYSKPDLTKKVRFHAKEQKTTEEDDTHATIYDNYVAERTTGDMVQDVVQDVVQEQQQTAASAPSGVNLKVAAVLLSLLFIVSVAAVVVTATISLHNGSQNEEFLRRLGHMTENLSQQLMTNNRNLSKKFDLLTAVVDAVASTLNATSHNISRRMDGLAEAIGKGPCPADWTWFITSCYLKSTSSKNWEDGRKFCQERGGDLVVVSNRLEQLFIMSFDVNVWIGVRSEGSPTDWKGVNNASIRTTFWASGEPNNLWRKVNCVEVVKKSSVDNWNDEDCGKKNDFICEQHVAL